MFFVLVVVHIILESTSAVYSRQQIGIRTQRNSHQNISNLLDSLLLKYDNNIRPNFGGPPVVVEVDIMVRSMGPISEIDMTYSMDCYFRQSWVDKRLAFPGDTSDSLALSISMLGRIWKPDTYFYNGKFSYLHTITTPNKFVRLFQDGRVLYSSRLTIKAACPMNLADFPMDVQRCPLKFGSFGYTTNDVLYHWNRARQVAIAEDMKLSQFDLISTPAGNHTDIFINSDQLKGEYSMLVISFYLRRHMGNFVIQVYGPCVLLVVLSWVSFWLNREATADRVSLGITTVLTMTFLGLEARTDLPKVPYPTALDFFVLLSFSFIFATIIQFAVVHYFTKYGFGECYFDLSSSSESSDSSDNEEWKDIGPQNSTNREVQVSILDEDCDGGGGICRETTTATSTDPNFIEFIPLAECTIPKHVIHQRRHPSWNWFSCLKEIEDQSSYSNTIQSSQTSIRTPSNGLRSNAKRRRRRPPRFNSVSKIDRVSRVAFPLLFLTINVFYWYSYLSRTKRILKGDLAIP